MGHVPHLLLPSPWAGPEIPLAEEQLHQLARVLRMRAGEGIAYTDGRGRLGRGRLGEGTVLRGEELQVPPPAPRLTLAVAPPKATARTRFLVEKAAELGVDRLLWLESRRGEARPPRPDKAGSWAAAALEQSRGAWLLELGGPVPLDQLVGRVWILDPGGGPMPEVESDLTLVAGPEGGLESDEVALGERRVGLGARILRVETAALAGAILALERLGRLAT